MSREPGGPTSCDIGSIPASVLASLLEDAQQSEQVLAIDCRSFLDYNSGHMKHAVYMPTSTLMKRRLEQGKITIAEFLHLPTTAQYTSRMFYVVLYTSTDSVDEISSNCFVSVVAEKLAQDFQQVLILEDGFSQFHAAYPHLCTTQDPKPTMSASSPCISTLKCGPTKIFPHMYLGSEQDALSQEVLKTKGINYILNVSVSCPKADFINDSHFMRIPVNDTYSDKLICHFIKAFQFLDKVQSSNGCALVHCMAGISRSPTLVIAYVMHTLKLPYDEAYRYVKEKRPEISPNFNFLGQLVEFGRNLKNEENSVENKISKADITKKHPSLTLTADSSCKRQRLVALNSTTKNRPSLSLDIAAATASGQAGYSTILDDLSPSTALARISLASAEA